jgi:spore coat-associated protein N
MKNIKKALLGTALAGSLIVGAGIGTYSWYTAESHASGTIQTGNFGLSQMGNLFDQKQFAPSQVIFSETQTLENTGSLPQILKATYTHKVDQANLSKYKVGYIAYKYKDNQSTEEPKQIKDKLNAVLNGTFNIVDSNAPSKSLSLNAASTPSVEMDQGVFDGQQLQSLSVKAANKAGVMEKTIIIGDGDKQKFWTLKKNEHIEIRFAVKLSENAGMEYQNVKYDATFDVEAKQVDPGALYQSEIDAAKSAN